MKLIEINNFRSDNSKEYSIRKHDIKFQVFNNVGYTLFIGQTIAILFKSSSEV